LETDTFPILDAFTGTINFFPFSPEALIGLLVLFILLILSALISGSEVAFFSLEPKELEELRGNNKHTSSLVIRLLSTPEKLLATILVGNNFVNIAIVILSSFITNSLIDFSDAPTLGFIFQAIIITFIILLFGEIVPKVYATHYSRKFSLRMAPLLAVMEKIFRPLNSILINSTSFVNRRLLKHRKNLSIDEISKALKLTDQIELSEDKEILEGIVKFGNISVNEIMLSRLDIIALDIEDDFTKVFELINKSGYSRIPVYSETLDNIKGILYIKDLLLHVDKGYSFRWQSLIRPPFFIPETKKIDDLLGEFQRAKIHMAIVVDEYGGTSGLVTLEDVLEEIVGDIADEFDEEQKFFTQIGENEYIFDGKTMLNDFYKTVDCNEDIFDDIKGEADTLAGLILEIKGEIPQINEEIDCKIFRLIVTSADARRIKKIKVSTISDTIEEGGEEKK
jgi:gliding motility-associated protein GldE